MPTVPARKLAARRAAERYRQKMANRRAADAFRELAKLPVKDYYTSRDWQLSLPIVDTDEILEGLDR